MPGTLICLLLAATAIWSWMDGLRARELAVRYGHELCRQAGVQLLDQSVALRRLRLARSEGRLQWRRRYGFEISMNGSDRHRGHLDLHGARLATWSMPWIATTEMPESGMLPNASITASRETSI